MRWRFLQLYVIINNHMESSILLSDGRDLNMYHGTRL